MIGNQRTVHITRYGVRNDNNDNHSLFFEQTIDEDDLSSDEQHQISRSSAVSSSMPRSPAGKPEDWNFYDLCRTAFATIHQAHKYRRDGQTSLAIAAYKDTLTYCVHIKRRNTNSDKNGIELNRQVSSLKLECRQHLNKMTNDTWVDERIYVRSVRECGVCMIEQSIDQFEERCSDQCQHTERSVCNTCVYNTTKSALEDGRNIKVICPESNCEAVFSCYEVYQVLIKSGNQALFELYERKLTYLSLEQMSDFTWCPYRGCGAGQLNVMNSSGHNRVICIKCERKICVYHRMKWHTGMTCEEYDRSKIKVDPETKQWLDKYSKPCPICKSPIEKEKGCDHLLCIKCHHQFCWECLADYELVRIKGLGQHRPTCSHHPDQRVQLHTNKAGAKRCTLL